MPNYISLPDNIQLDQDPSSNYVSLPENIKLDEKVGAVESLSRGFSDAPVGIAQAQINAGYVPGYEPSPFSKKSQQMTGALNAIKSEDLAATTNKDIAQSEADYQRRRGTDRFDWMRLLGNIAGGLPTNAVGGGIVGTTLGGALSAASQPVTEGSDYWAQKGKQTAFGAGTALAFGGLAKGTEALGNYRANTLGSEADQAARYMADRGVQLPMGRYFGKFMQGAEEKATSIPIVGDFIKSAQGRSIEQFNRAVYNEVLSPLGLSAEKIPVGQEGVAEVGKIISKSYDDVLPALKFQVDDQFKNEVGNVIDMMNNAAVPKGVIARFNKILENNLGSRIKNGGGMDGLTFKAFEENMGKIAANLKSGNADDRALGDALGEVLTSARDTLTRVNPPELAAKIGATNEAFKRLVRLDRAAGSNVSTGVFTPEAFAQAVKFTDTSARGAAVGRGKAVMQELASNAVKTIGRVYPDSGTAGRVMQTVTGGAAFYDPILTGTSLAIGSLPYTSIGQNVISGLLTKPRGSFLKGTSGLLGRSAIPLAAGAGLLAGSQ